MKTNLFLLVLIGLVVYVMVKTNQQLAATSAALQTNKPLVAIETPSPVVTVKEPIVTTNPVDVPPVDYLSAYNNA